MTVVPQPPEQISQAHLHRDYKRNLHPDSWRLVVFSVLLCAFPPTASIPRACVPPSHQTRNHPSNPSSSMSLTVVSKQRARGGGGKASSCKASTPAPPPPPKCSSDHPCSSLADFCRPGRLRLDASPQSSLQIPPQLLLDVTEQLGLENELALLVLLARVVGLVVRPAHIVLALATEDVPHDVSARRHVPLVRLPGGDVHDRVEEVGFAVLAAEVLHTGEGGGMDVSMTAGREGAGARTYPAYDVLVVREMGLAVLAAVDLAAREIDVVEKPHDGRYVWRSEPVRGLREPTFATGPLSRRERERGVQVVATTGRGCGAMFVPG